MKKTFQIQNLKCEGCQHTIIDLLLSIEGVQNIAVDVEKSSVTLTYESNIVFEKVRSKLSHIGYPLVGDTNTTVKKAISYISCALGKLNA